MTKKQQHQPEIIRSLVTVAVNAIRGMTTKIATLAQAVVSHDHAFRNLPTKARKSLRRKFHSAIYAHLDTKAEVDVAKTYVHDIWAVADRMPKAYEDFRKGKYGVRYNVRSRKPNAKGQTFDQVILRLCSGRNKGDVRKAHDALGKLLADMNRKHVRKVTYLKGTTKLA